MGTYFNERDEAAYALDRALESLGADLERLDLPALRAHLIETDARLAKRVGWTFSDGETTLRNAIERFRLH